MKDEIALVKNIIAAAESFDAVINRNQNMPGMVLWYGFAGTGKTTATEAQAVRNKGILVRANVLWTPKSMLTALCKEVSIEPEQSCAPMMDALCEHLAQTPKPQPIFVDDINQVLENQPKREARRVLELLRDIHDITKTPVILCGHQGTERRIQEPQIRRRIVEVVEFRPLDLDDSRIVYDTVCEIPVEDALLQAIHEHAKGNVGLMTIPVPKIERKCKANKAEIATLEMFAEDLRRADFWKVR